jgi:molybdate transport system regulatory protein
VPRKEAHLSIRIDLVNGRFGPGKAALLRAIGETGSISAAARLLGMSYAKAWHLTEDMNSVFQERLVDTFAGGNRRGGATLTPAGEKMLHIYQSICDEAEHVVAKKLALVSTI